jgi:GT2 family glycosyltransferase
MEVSIIIPAYYIDDDFVEMTQDCVNSVRSTCKPYEIIVVDDGSPVKAEIDFATNIRLPENKGYAGAVIKGYEHAEGDVLIILNNDTLAVEGWYDGLLDPIKQGYDIVSIRTSDSDGYEKEEKITEGDKFGSCWAIRSTVWHDLGGLSEEFGRGYAEDLDLWKRAIKKGYRIAKNHNAVIFHEGKKTFKAVDPDDSYYMEALMKYKDKHGTID